MKAINTSVYIQQPGYRGFVNNPPNSLYLTKYLHAHISRGDNVTQSPYTLHFLTHKQYDVSEKIISKDTCTSEHREPRNIPHLTITVICMHLNSHWSSGSPKGV